MTKQFERYNVTYLGRVSDDDGYYQLISIVAFTKNNKPIQEKYFYIKDDGEFVLSKFSEEDEVKELFRNYLNDSKVECRRVLTIQRIR